MTSAIGIYEGADDRERESLEVASVGRGSKDDFAAIAEVFGIAEEQDGGETVLTLHSKLEDLLGNKFRWESKGARKRTAFHNRAYVGPNGTGKTLAMMHDLIPGLLKGRLVYSTVKILDPWTGNPHPQYRRLTEWAPLLDENLKHIELILDEIQGVANARASQGMPVQVQTILHQLRRRDIALSWTSPSWSRADILIREVTDAVTVCRGYFPVMRKDYNGEEIQRSWGDRRLFRWTTYDAKDMNTWTDNSEYKLKGKINTWLWRPALGPFGKPAVEQFLYDSLDSVDRVGEVLDAGTCAYCGGIRKRKPCTCGHEH